MECRLQDLQKLGIEADIIQFHPYDHWGFAKMDQAHDEAYIRYVAARFSAFRNVWWTMANEYNIFDSRIPNVGPDVIKNWDRLFQTLQAADPYGHLRGMHNAGPWYDDTKPWITHVVAQEDWRLPHMVAKGRAYGKPVVIDEYGYEGNTGEVWGDLTGREVMDRHWQISMAGGYASHGETYVHPGGLLWWAIGGELAGESPARLKFLKEIMTVAPFQELTPDPTAVMGGQALALAGQYYLFYFSKPNADPVQIRVDGSAPFNVDLIDPWQMKIYRLGRTSVGSQAMHLPLIPCLLRLTPARGTAAGGLSANLTELLARFIGDTTNPSTPSLRPFVQPREYYSLDFTLDELLDNSRARAAVEKFQPDLIKMRAKSPLIGGLAGRALVNSFDNESPGTAYAQVKDLEAALAQIPSLPTDEKAK